MAVAGEYGFGSAFPVAAGQGRFHAAPCLYQGGTPDAFRNGGWVIIQYLMYFGKHIQNAGPPEGFPWKLLRKLHKDPEIQQKVQYVLIPGADGNPFCLETEIRNRTLLERLLPDDIMPGVELYGQPEPFPGPGMAADAVAVMVPVARHCDFGGKGSAGNPVFPQQGFIPAQIRIQIQRLSVQGRRDGVIGKEPAIAPRAAPQGLSLTVFREREQRGIGHGVEPLLCLVHGKGENGGFGEDIRLVNFQGTGKLGEQFFVLSIIQHGRFLLFFAEPVRKLIRGDISVRRPPRYGNVPASGGKQFSELEERN